jgi:hypothetical protein
VVSGGRGEPARESKRSEAGPPAHPVQGAKQIPVETLCCLEAGSSLVGLGIYGVPGGRRVCGNREDGHDQGKACRKARPRKRLPSLTWWVQREMAR